MIVESSPDSDGGTTSQIGSTGHLTGPGATSRATEEDGAETTVSQDGTTAYSGSTETTSSGGDEGTTSGDAGDTTTIGIETTGDSTTTTVGWFGTTTGGDDDDDDDDDDDSTTTGDVECCEDYPVGMGCDEEDDGVVAEEGGDDGIILSGGIEDSGVGLGDDFPLGTTIALIQLDAFDVGDYLLLEDVIVTSPAASIPGGDGVMFTVTDPSGGPDHGLTVRTVDSPLVEALQPGDAVTLIGHLQYRYVFPQLSVEAEDIKLLGTATLPHPVVIAAEDIEHISSGGTLAESLESVVVQVQHPMVVDPHPCAGEVEVQAGLRIDDRFLVDAGLELPPPAGPGYEAVQGVLLYTYNGFEVAPRSLDDIVE